MDRRKNIRLFDVFATCLARRFAAPSDLFLDLGRRMKFEGYGLSQETDAETFWAARIEAERRTSLKSSAEEITLDEIWAELTA